MKVRKVEQDEEFRGWLGHVDLFEDIRACTNPKCGIRYIYGEVGPGDGNFFTMSSPHNPADCAIEDFENGNEVHTFSCHACKKQFAKLERIHNHDEWTDNFVTIE